MTAALRGWSVKHPVVLIPGVAWGVAEDQVLLGVLQRYKRMVHNMHDI